jgi:hypothetical protein
VVATAANSETVLVYSGDADDISLSVRHDRPTGTTTIDWSSVSQPLEVTGYHLFSGAMTGQGGFT